MKFVCINKRDLIEGPKPILIEGNVYTMKKKTKHLIWVIDETGQERMFNSWRFISLDKWRRKKINTICKD